jgi:hypothetical protein
MFQKHGHRGVTGVAAAGALSGAILGLLISTATPSLAAVTVTINNPAILTARGAGVEVSGSVTCAYSAVGQVTQRFSDQDSMTVSITETTPSGPAAGSVNTAGPPCNGSTNAWDVIVPDSADVAFVAGSGSVSVAYKACTFGQNGVVVECQQASQNATIKIVNPVTGTRRGHHK